MRARDEASETLPAPESGQKPSERAPASATMTAAPPVRLRVDPASDTLSADEAPFAAADSADRAHAATVDAAALRAGGMRGSDATMSAGGDLNLGLAELSEPPPIRLSNLPASLQDRFESLHFLGEGAMGAVYRARDRRLGRDVALKFLFGGGADTSARLMREARSQARLEHENACKVYEAGVADGHRFIVMQYINGEPLDKAKLQMTLEEKIRAIRQVTLALHEAHRLGLVHRDIKPSNIMVELGEDGAYKPYLMDFGLAREVSERGATVTGSIAGTPAFMAPEQALGEIRSLDRRTDVYCLGATMYDLLGGRPPFLDENIFRLLQRVALEDPVALRKLRPEVPEDVEAIVMKCLEKEPARRYDSARALGDDLQRFLDGEPVLARRASLGYVLRKKLRRHKGKVALASVAILVLLAMGIGRAREQRLAAEQARISRELGEDVKEMELFLRNSYSLPLHDIEREKEVVRARLRHVEERMNAVGPAGKGPGHYALGRGYLALREPEEARKHLERSRSAGYSPPELDYALGLTLGELYKKELEATKRIEDSVKKAARVAAIEAEYKINALAHLRAALGARLEVPAYVEGLIALYEGKNDEARALAEEAFRRAPWLYDAKKLEGDAHFAEGSRFRFDAAYDYDRMMDHFNRADAAYQAAADIARSDPEVHLAACELWIQVMNASEAKPELLKSGFDKASLACDRGIAASPRSSGAHVKMAFAHIIFAWHARAVAQGGQEPDTIIDKAMVRAEEAVRVSPGEAMASYLLGVAWRVKFFFLMNQGLDPGGSIDSAIVAYEQAIRLDPTLLWARAEICSAYAQRALNEGWRGRDPAASVQGAEEHCDRAIGLEPSFAFSYINKAVAHVHMALYLIESGRSPERAIASALSVVEAAMAKSPGSIGAQGIASWAHYLRAIYETDAGRDAGPSLALMEKSIRDIEAVAPAFSMLNELRGRLASAKAHARLVQKSDPEPELKLARAPLDKLVAETPWDYDFRLVRAQVEVVAARWVVARGEDPAKELDAATEPLLPLLKKERARPHLYQTLAEIHELRATSLLSARKKADEVISVGIEMAEKALAINPHMGSAHAAKGGLYLLRARGARAANEKVDAATRAKEALTAAIRDNPLLERDRKAALEEAQRLLTSK